MSEEVALQESRYQPSELAKSIGAIFLPADWRRRTYGHYQRLEMIDQLLCAAQPPTADAETVAREIVRDVFTAKTTRATESASTELVWRFTTALSAAKQQGRDEQREKDARGCEGLVEDHGDKEPCKYCLALETAAATIRSNQ